MSGRKGDGERRYSSAACVACRKKKIRCDNAQPKCSNCRLYSSECILGQDRRRGFLTKQAFVDLNSRIEGLEGLLSAKQKGEPSLPPQQIGEAESTQKSSEQGAIPQQDRIYDSMSSTGPSSLDLFYNSSMLGNYEGADLDCWTQINESTTLPDLFLDVQQEIRPEDDEDGMMFPGPLADETRATLPHESALTGVGENRALADFNTSSGLETSSDAVDANLTGNYETFTQSWARDHESPGSEDDITQQLSNRFGRLYVAEDGHERYFGATSHLHMVPKEVGSFFKPYMRSVREEGEASVDRAGLQWDPDPEYEDHLERLYFAWHNVWVNEVHKDIYYQEKEVYMSGRDTPLYSPALKSAMLAMGACYSKRDNAKFQGRPSDFFAARTRVYLEIEMDSPTLATTQAAIILSALECANGRDSRGWIYSGIAVQMATDLGLHLNIGIDRNYLDAETDVERVMALRRNLFWVIYSADTFHSVYTGRPSLMGRIKYSCPSLSSPPPYSWEPYLDTQEEMTLPPEADKQTAGMVSVYLSQIAMKTQKISNTLYSGVSNSLETLQIFVLAMAKELKHWLSALPLAYQVPSGAHQGSRDQVPLPVVLQLHMVYQQTTILLHRPFVGENDDSTICAGETCSNAAKEICRLLALYRRRYSLRCLNVHAVALVTTAGIAHAYDSCVFSGTRGKIAQEHLMECIRALGEMGQTFNSAIRGLEIITSLRRMWQTQNFLQSSTKRQRGSFTQPSRPQDSVHKAPT